jgi:ketosteroid isomerase-like protein
MKKISAVLVMVILAVGLSSARGQEKKGDTVAELKALDAKLTDAFKTHDLQKLGKHIDDEYMLIDPRGGVHNKKQYLEYMAEGPSKVKDLKETDVKVRVFGETAVVSGLLHVKGKVDDKDIHAEYRWTRVYNKRGNEWLCVLEQHTHVLTKEAGK